MITPLLEIVEVSRVLAAVGAGTSEQFTSIVDTANCDGVMFIVGLGTPAVDNIVRAQQNIINSATGMADLEGSGKASGAANCVVIDVGLPVEQFIRAGIVRATSTTIEAVFAVKYNKAKQATTQPSGTVAKAVVGAAEGTAGS